MKLERYGAVVAALRNMMLWWQTLPEVDKARCHSTAFVDELLHRKEATEGEGIDYCPDDGFLTF